MNDYRHFHYNLRLSDHLIICFLWEPTLEQHFEIIFVYFFFAFYWTNKANNCHSKWIIYFPPPHHHFLLLPSLFSLGQLRNHFFQLLLHLRLGGQLLLLLLSTHKPFYSNPIQSNPIKSNPITPTPTILPSPPSLPEEQSDATSFADASPPSSDHLFNKSLVLPFACTISGMQTYLRSYHK